MPLARFTVGQHDDQNCTGCPACNEDAARMLDETPAQSARRLRAANAALAQEYRITESLSESERLARKIQGYGSVVTATPDAYGVKLPKPVCPRDDPGYQPHGEPADSYELALRRKKARV